VSEGLAVRRTPALTDDALTHFTNLLSGGLQMARWALEEAAMAAIRTKDVYLAARYARLRPRHGHKKALGAVKHSILIACWHMLSTGVLYNDLGGGYFRKRNPERITKRLVAQPPSARTPTSHSKRLPRRGSSTAILGG
jgi:hypothetical protein